MKNINQNLIKIAELLNDGQFHDGDTIGSRLNITRAAVWKVLTKFKNYGIPLESVKGKGYLLRKPLILLNQKKINSDLKYRLNQFDVFEKLGSTSDYLKNFVHGNKKIRACISETQNQGRGRFQRHWHSPFGLNIYFSLLYPFQKDVSELSGLSLVIALALFKTITSVIHIKNKDCLSIKWPNDILFENSKLAGVLIEIQAESNGFCQAVIGIGLNVNMSHATQKNINQPWSSLLKMTEQHHDRNHLCSNLINYLIDYLERFLRYGMKAFMEEWKEKDKLFGRTVSLVSGKHKYTGICVGINEKGHLLLKSADNVIQSFSSGDTTLLK